jgi:SAM-dependent methyltransferase
MGGLTMRQQEVACSTCGRTYRCAEAIPVFVDESAAEHDELEHLAGQHGDIGREHFVGQPRDERAGVDGHKAAQSAWFDRDTLADFEVERPFGSPEFYRFLLTEKFRRSVQPFNGRLDGWTALAVCGGSGMDAEFLARAGASVISSDISLGAARRVRERSKRHGVAILPIVADVEHLPFADRSVDLVYVHDGLHHLEDPFAGLAEMARVARQAVCISEPARASATSIAVRLGLALDREDAGNRVARLQPNAVSATFHEAGLHVVHVERYAMYYRHVPGALMSFLSRRPLFDVVVLGWRLANKVIGRFGNKLTMVAIR